MRFVPLPNMSRPGFGGKFARRFSRVAAAGVFALAFAGPVRAEDGFHPLDSLLRTMDLKTDVGRAPDFVEASRPKGENDYVSVGQPHPQRTIKVKTPAELKAAEAALDAARVHHDQISGRKPPDPKALAAKKAAATVPPKPATQN